ncbi:MAG: hypothetical protein WD063_16275 [Pirellulales bacterium]
MTDCNSPRIVSVAACFLAAFFAAGTSTSRSFAAEIVFDLPESIECREVTPPEFAAHEYLKVIEGKMRISARMASGTEAEIVDFVYNINCPDKHVRFQDYLPNTTLESAVADDQIEIRDATEKAQAAGADVHVVYKLLALGGTLSQSSKNSESSHYRQIAAKELVVASGTTDREHGVFFRLRPSRAGSLEGAKEFTFLATVPKGWHGDVCTISCAARANKDSFFSTAIVPAGTRVAEVGMCLAGDAAAASLAEDLRRAQETHAKLLAAQPQKPCVLETISSEAVGLFAGKKSNPEASKELEEAEKTVADVQLRLKQLAR